MKPPATPPPKPKLVPPAPKPVPPPPLPPLPPSYGPLPSQPRGPIRNEGIERASHYEIRAKKGTLTAEDMEKKIELETRRAAIMEEAAREQAEAAARAAAAL